MCVCVDDGAGSGSGGSDITGFQNYTFVAVVQTLQCLKNPL